VGEAIEQTAQVSREGDVAEQDAGSRSCGVWTCPAGRRESDSDFRAVIGSSALFFFSFFTGELVLETSHAQLQSVVPRYCRYCFSMLARPLTYMCREINRKATLVNRKKKKNILRVKKTNIFERKLLFFLMK
jgi:hypothetical protein